MTTSQPAAPGAESYQLRSHAVGVPGIVLFVISAAAPLAATLGVAPIVFGTAGKGAPLAYAVAGVLLLLFSVGYAAMSRHVTSSAGFAAYIEKGFGRVPGFAAATTAVFSYNAMLIGIYGAFGFFTQAVVDQYLGFNWPWQVWTFLAIAAVGVLGYLDINLSARILGTLMMGEVALLLLFDIIVPAKGGADGVSFDGFVPSNLLNSGAVGITILFAAVQRRGSSTGDEYSWSEDLLVVRRRRTGAPSGTWQREVERRPIQDQRWRRRDGLRSSGGDHRGTD